MPPSPSPTSRHSPVPHHIDGPDAHGLCNLDDSLPHAAVGRVLDDGVPWGAQVWHSQVGSPPPHPSCITPAHNVPGSRLSKSVSMRSAVQGLMLSVAAHSSGMSLGTRSRLSSGSTACVRHVPVQWGKDSAGRPGTAP